VRRPVRRVIGCKLKQNANEGCNSCASLARLVLSFIACFILLVFPLVDSLCCSALQFDWQRELLAEWAAAATNTRQLTDG